MCNIEEDVMGKECSTEKRKKKYVENWGEQIIYSCDTSV
jgi:hypothetical protein